METKNNLHSHEFYENDLFDIYKFRTSMKKLIMAADSNHKLADDFLNPFGFEVLDNPSIFLKDDLKRFYLYVKPTNKISNTEKKNIFNNFLYSLKLTYPLFYNKISVYIIENSKFFIIKNKKSFEKYGDKSKLICLNFIETNKPLLEYYSEYIIATLPGFYFGKTIEYIKYEKSFTRNLRSIQLYIMIEKLFETYVQEKNSLLLTEICKTKPSNSPRCYFEEVKPQYNNDIKSKIENRLQQLYYAVRPSEHDNTENISLYDINTNEYYFYSFNKNIILLVKHKISQTYFLNLC